MIRNQWYVVLESNEVGRQPVSVTRLGEKMVFWRDQAGVAPASVSSSCTCGSPTTKRRTGPLARAILIARSGKLRMAARTPRQWRAGMRQPAPALLLLAC